MTFHWLFGETDSEREAEAEAEDQADFDWRILASIALGIPLTGDQEQRLKIMKEESRERMKERDETEGYLVNHL